MQSSFKEQVDELVYCPRRDDYFSCDCTRAYLSCSNIPLNLVAEVFKNKPGRDIDQPFLLVPLPTDISFVISANNLYHHRARSFIIQCIEFQQIIIDEDAFGSSRNVTESVYLNGCDIRKLEFFFLKDFCRLKRITLSLCANVHLAGWARLPPLDSLNELIIKNSAGYIDSWVNFPVLTRGLIRLRLPGNYIDDETLTRILGWVVNSPSNKTLLSLGIDNNALTGIPEEISSFKNLREFFMSTNSMKIVRSRSLAFNFRGFELFLRPCSIHTIESGAF